MPLTGTREPWEHGRRRQPEPTIVRESAREHRRRRRQERRMPPRRRPGPPVSPYPVSEPIREGAVMADPAWEHLLLDSLRLSEIMPPKVRERGLRLPAALLSTSWHAVLLPGL